jgi:hypothetical protein
MATDAERQALVERAAGWVRTHGCGLPYDLHLEMLNAGLDAGRIESQLEEENNSAQCQEI